MCILLYIYQTEEKGSNEMAPKDLKPMDIVLRRDGQVLWVLQNDYTKEIMTFLPDMWGQQLISDYDDKFQYKGLDMSRMSRSEREKHKKKEGSKDIMAVSKCRSYWKSINLMREYELAKKKDDRECLEACMKEFQWIQVLER